MLNKKLISFSLALLLGISSLISVNAYADDDSNSQNSNPVVTESSTINSYPTEGNYQVLNGPVYKTYTNKDIKILTNLFCSWVISKYPNLKDGFLAPWISTVLLDELKEGIQPTYVSIEVGKTWSYVDQCHIYYATVIHYSDSTYKNPIHVQFIEVDRSVMGE